MSTIIDFDDLALRDRSQYQHPDSFGGLPVVEYDPADPPAVDAHHAYRFSSDWDNEERFSTAFAHFASAPRSATHLLIGPWSSEMYDDDTEDIVAALCAAAANLPELRAVYFGDITSEENEMSWINQSDVSPILTAFPALELLRVRGGNGLGLTANNHEQLRGLCLETGGMDASVVRSVMTSSFPKLEHLELWLGTEHYGLTATVEDLQPLLSGALFPELRYLGLRNCDFADDIAGVIVNSPIIDRIERLDLSMGILTDDGAQALLGLPTDGRLQSLDVHHNFMSASMADQLAALPIDVDVSGRLDEQEWRYVAIGE